VCVARNSAGPGHGPSGRPQRRAGPARKIGHRAVPGPPVRPDAQHGPAQKKASGCIGPGQIVPGPGSGRAARLEYYNRQYDIVSIIVYNVTASAI
jgi:hypothetical protein